MEVWTVTFWYDVIDAECSDPQTWVYATEGLALSHFDLLANEQAEIFDADCTDANEYTEHTMPGSRRLEISTEAGMAVIILTRQEVINDA